MRRLYLLTHEEAGRLMQFRIVNVERESTTLHDFLKKPNNYYGCLVEMEVTDKSKTLKFEDCLAISLPIMQTNVGKTIYGSVYLTDKAEWLKGKLEI